MILPKQIVVLSSATRSGGAYMIYKQFINHLKDRNNDHRYYIFVDSSMYQPQIDGVEYIHEDNHSWLHRIYMDRIGWGKILMKKGVKPDLIISFQNTAMVTKLPQILYFHTSFAFYPNKWNPFKRTERDIWLYKHIHPYLVNMTLNKKTNVVVQIPYIKRAFMKKFHWPDNRIHVLFPDMENIDVSLLQDNTFNDDKYHFIYPANPLPYKQHLTIANAVKLIKINNPSIGDKIRVHFTIEEHEYLQLSNFVKTNGLKEQILFEGKIEHNKLLEKYQTSIGLLFPSVIETLGLPLIEAARFGLPIIASDLDYAREVLDGYPGVMFLASNDYMKWANSIEALCVQRPRYTPYGDRCSSWPQFFELVDQCLVNRNN